MFKNYPDNQALMYYAATTTDPKISRPIYKADGTVEGYMTSIVSTKWLKGNKTLMNKATKIYINIYHLESAVNLK
jgi:hypothetical protein